MIARRTVLRACLYTAALLTAAPHAQAAAPTGPLATLSERLENTRTIHADFRQTKHLAALKRPLQSTGRIVFVRGQGVLWVIDKPYQASYALTADTVVETGPDGRRKVRDAREVPALAYIGRVFESLFAGKLAQLDEYFDVTVLGSAANWRLDLAPKPALAPFLQGIRASGGAFVERIEVSEARGDRTEIEFSASTLDVPLSDADAQRLRQR